MKQGNYFNNLCGKIYAVILLAVISIFGTLSAAAQETEAAASSSLSETSLPKNAQRVKPENIPAEVTATLDKVIAAGGGKLRKGETEVLVWTGADYDKSRAPLIVDRLTETLKMANWTYSPEASESGITVFTAIKNGVNRRSLVGFYGATDDALVFAWMEVLANAAQDADKPQSEAGKTVSTRLSGGGLVGTWSNGSTSMLGEKNMTTGAVTSRGGSTYKYVFTADGRFEFIGLMNSTMYGCTTSLFNDKRGRYEISGSQITLIPSKNFWRNTYSCSPASNKERDYTLERETYSFRTKTDEYGKTLVCLDSGKGEACYQKAE